MNLKSITKGLAVLNIAAFVLTAAAAWLFDKRSAPELLDTATYVGLGMGALGAIMFVGSSRGGSEGMAASAADRPSRVVNALWMDRNAGISAGALFVLGGIIWVGIAWLVAALFE